MTPSALTSLLARIEELEGKAPQWIYDEDDVRVVRDALPALIAIVRVQGEALQFVTERNSFAFAECSEAEELWRRCSEAQARAERLAKGE